ncbi:MAG: hypothetical protein ACOY0T_12005 [Myxococcota bacterium]
MMSVERFRDRCNRRARRALVAAIAVVPACEDPFEDCAATRSCPIGGKQSAEGGSAGSADEPTAGASGSTSELGGVSSTGGVGGSLSSMSEAGSGGSTGETRACGACLDGTQTCINGRTGQYSACIGAVLFPTTWYRDADGDGFGSAATTTVCSSMRPVGYTDQRGDCCDDGGNLTLAAQIHPGQTEFFQDAANLCGIKWDYDCSGKVELWVPDVYAGCVSGATPPNCASVVQKLTDASCGTIVGGSSCAEVPNPPGPNVCNAQTSNGGSQRCH